MKVLTKTLLGLSLFGTLTFTACGDENSDNNDNETPQEMRDDTPAEDPYYDNNDLDGGGTTVDSNTNTGKVGADGNEGANMGKSTGGGDNIGKME